MVFGKRHRTGFYRIRRIDEHNLICSADSDVQLHHADVHHVVYVIVTNKLATYYELCHVYTIWEVLDLYDIAMTTNYNKHVLLENKH